VVDLLRQGEAQVVLEIIMNTLLVIGLNQDMFKEKLTPTYGQRKWPNFGELANELRTYVEATKRMKQLRKDKNDGKVLANVAKQMEKQSGSGRWNCRLSLHIKVNCRAPSSKCDNCGDLVT